MLSTFELLERSHKRLAAIVGGMSLLIIRRKLTLYTISSWRASLKLAIEDLNKMEEHLHERKKSDAR